VIPGGARLRPLGFLVLMLGFGLRLDSSWQGAAWVLLVVGGTLTAAGFAALAREPPDVAAFVSPEPKR